MTIRPSLEQMLRMKIKTLFQELLEEWVDQHRSPELLAEYFGKLGLSCAPNSIRAWMEPGGRRPHAAKARELMQVMNVPPERIKAVTAELRREPPLHVVRPVGADYTQIPYLEVRADAGAGQFQTSTAIKSALAFRTDWLVSVGQPAYMAAMRITGDSMEPLVYDGDVVLVDTSQTEVMGGRLYAVWMESGLRLKRLLTGSRAWEEFLDACHRDKGQALCGPYAPPMLVSDDAPGEEGELSGDDWYSYCWEQFYARIAVTSDNYKKYQPEFPELGDQFRVVGRAVWLGRDLARI